LKRKIDISEFYAQIWFYLPLEPIFINCTCAHFAIFLPLEMRSKQISKSFWKIFRAKFFLTKQ